MTKDTTIHILENFSRILPQRTLLQVFGLLSAHLNLLYSQEVSDLKANVYVSCPKIELICDGVFERTEH